MIKPLRNPLAYQWLYNGNSISNGDQYTGTASNMLVLNYAVPLVAGEYSVIVSGIGGSVTSAVAILTVNLLCCTPTREGLLVWWAGDNNVADIAGTNSVRLEGGASACTVGLVGSAFDFDGTSGYAEIPDCIGLHPTNLSVECWVWLRSLDAEGTLPPREFIIFKQNSRTTEIESFALSEESVSERSVFVWQITSAANSRVRLESESAALPNTWYHLIGVRGTDFIQLYVDGNLEASSPIDFPQDYGSFPFYFGGSDQGVGDTKLNGLLDEVVFYNRALPSNEVMEAYQSGAGGHCKGPSIALQPLGKTALWGGTVIFDALANGGQPLTYFWQKDGAVLTGATCADLILTNLQACQAGQYAMAATNVYGAVTSSPVCLQVKVADVTILMAGDAQQKTPALQIGGLTGQVYGIEYSTNLTVSNSWIGLTNVTLINETGVWVDPYPSIESKRFYRIVPGPIQIGPRALWETTPIGALVNDDFNRSSLGANWTVLGGVSATIASGELFLNQADVNPDRQVYYNQWLTCSHNWTIRWTQRFGALNAQSWGVGVGIKNFQYFGGDDRGYNGMLCRAGPDKGKMRIQRYDGSSQSLAASGPAINLQAGDLADCSLARCGWTVTASATNRTTGQISLASLVFSDPDNLIAPTISRPCLYPLGGAIYVDDFSFSIDEKKPARFIVIGASSSEGYNASSYERGYVSVIQSNFTERICNDSSSYNTTSDALSILPEILAHQPGTALLQIGGNDVYFGVPASQWQSQYLDLVAQLQANGIKVKHILPNPRNSMDLTAYKDWIIHSFPSKDVINGWTPFVVGAHSLNPVYDSGDGVHMNDAGHLLLGQIIAGQLQ